MVKVDDIILMMEFTKEWQDEFNCFFNKLIALKWINEQGEIYVPDETYFEEIESIAREHNIRIIIHS